MAQVKDLTELTIKDLWQEVKGEEFWEQVSERTLYMLKLVLEDSMESELLEELRASWYCRTRRRKGYRNGYYERGLFTRYGLIKSLRVPRSREGHPTKILSNYTRREEQVDNMVRNMFLAGVSTRRVGEVLASLGAEKISAQTVSNIARRLDMEVYLFQHRTLSDSYLYLFFDGISLKVKGSAGVQRRQMLCVYGMTCQGRKELISFRQATDESEAKWEAFLRDLYGRGLEGKGCRLITTDGCPGLHKALETVYPYVPRQQCWVHKLRNVSNKIRRRDQKDCLAGARLIYLAKHRKEAIEKYKTWKTIWQSTYPRAVNCLSQDLDELLSFFGVPPAHRIKVRTTNAIERSFREVRRRVRPMTCFANPASVDRIIYGVISHLNQAWKDKPLPKFTQNT